MSVNTSRNIIVTCGTSQIGIDKIVDLPGLSESRDMSERLSDMHLAPGDMEGWTLAEIEHQEPDFNPLKTALVGIWGTLEEAVKRVEEANPFGAELSTLELMRNRYEDGLRRNAFDPREDQLSILWSDTKVGAFCAALLRSLVCDPRGWNMDVQRVHDRRVPGLRERPEKVDEVDANLIDQLRASLRDDTLSEALVYSGGFKASVPILTIFAIFRRGMTLYARYEESTELRITDFPDDLMDALEPCLKSYEAGTKTQGTPSLETRVAFSGRGIPLGGPP